MIAFELTFYSRYEITMNYDVDDEIIEYKYFEKGVFSIYFRGIEIFILMICTIY